MPGNARMKPLALMMTLVLVGAGASAGLTFMGQTIGVSETTLHHSVIVPPGEFSAANVSADEALTEINANGTRFAVNYEAAGGDTVTFDLPVKNRADTQLVAHIELSQTDGLETLMYDVSTTGADEFGDGCRIENVTDLAPAAPGTLEFMIPAQCHDRITVSLIVPSPSPRDFYRVIGEVDVVGDDSFVGSLETPTGGSVTVAAPHSSTPQATSTSTPTPTPEQTSANELSYVSSSLNTGEVSNLNFDFSSTASVVIDRVAIETQRDMARVTESGGNHRVEIKGISSDAILDRTDPIVYDGRWYPFDTTGYMTSGETANLALDSIQRQSEPVTITGLAPNRSTADIIVTLDLRDGSQKAFYFDAAEPAANQSFDTVSGSLLTGEQSRLRFEVTATDGLTIETVEFETQLDLAGLNGSASPHRFEIKGGQTDAVLDLDSSIVYDGRTYSLSQVGYLKAGDTAGLELDAVSSNVIQVNGFASNRSSADMIVRLTFGDGTSTEIYIDASPSS